MTYIPTRRLAAVCLAATVLVASAAARAEPGQQDQQETIAKIVALNREGVALYEKKHFDGARKVLKQALELCESAGLAHHPVAARTHIHLGIVIVAGFGQREIGSRQFGEALQIDPNITLTPGLETPAATEVFNEVLMAVSPKTGAAAAAQPPDDAPASGAPQGSDNELPADDAVAAARSEDAAATRPTTESGDDGDNNDAPRAQVRAA
ncbi:MAG TPA: tetratricopeptide repeat protein, partial [Polyangia bacterium]|nr:tetratricopeptide repeat protein [Polyangia bacterium]